MGVLIWATSKVARDASSFFNRGDSDGGPGSGNVSYRNIENVEFQVHPICAMQERSSRDNFLIPPRKSEAAQVKDERIIWDSEWSRNGRSMLRKKNGVRSKVG